MEKCGETIRSPKTGLKRTCPGELNNRGKCSYQKLHMMRINSGWCGTGHHEGTKAEVNGKVQRCCALWQTCPCRCHDDMSKVLAPRKQQRIAVGNGWIWEGPSFRIERICKDWFNGDRQAPCTVDFMLSEAFKEKPIDPEVVRKILAKWHTEGRAFVGSNPTRFLKFLR